MTAGQSSPKPTRRQAGALARRQAILDAALDVFAEQGFTAAKLDEIAARAGVAKGTIYLVCQDKEDLIKQVVLGVATPVLDQFAAANRSTAPARQDFVRLMQFVRRELLGSRRRLIAQVMLKEAGRFPALAEFHHREIVSRVLAVVSELMARARREGVLRSAAYADCPQLVMAPMVFVLAWDAMFAKLAPLDIDKLFEAHAEAIFGPADKKEDNA